MISSSVRIFLSITTIFIVVTHHRSAYSAEREGVDVVLVMDSSGSMKRTDPLSLRKPAAKLFVSLLDKGDRASVVSFSDNGYPIIHLTPVGTESNRESLLRAIDKISSDGVYTNLYDALNSGVDELSRDKDSTGTQVIILMSDGVMDVGDKDEDKKLVDQLRNVLIKRLKNNGIKVYTIAFTEQSDKQLLKYVARQTDGLYSLALTDKDFHATFTSIFEGVKMPDMLPLEGHKFVVDKSIQEVTIVASKNSSDISISLESPDGKMHKPNLKEAKFTWFLSPRFDMVTVKGPIVGNWKIHNSSGDDKAYIVTNLTLMTDYYDTYLQIGDSVDLKVWLEKDDTIIQRKEMLGTTDIFVEIIQPEDEPIRTVLYQDTQRGEGIFAGRFKPKGPGDYKLRVIAKGKTFQRERAFSLNISELVEEDVLPDTDDSVKDIKEESLEKAGLVEVEDKPPWGKVFAGFFLINLIFLVAAYSYFRGNQLKALAKPLLRWKKPW